MHRHQNGPRDRGAPDTREAGGNEGWNHQHGHHDTYSEQSVTYPCVYNGA
jgi:hypothetical protein